MFGVYREPVTETLIYTLKYFKEFYLKAKAIIWPCLSYMRHFESTEQGQVLGFGVWVLGIGYWVLGCGVLGIVLGI